MGSNLWRDRPVTPEQERAEPEPELAREDGRAAAVGCAMLRFATVVVAAGVHEPDRDQEHELDDLAEPRMVEPMLRR